MTSARSQADRRSLFSFLRREQTWVELSGYRVGDIQLDEPVFVLPQAHIVGNIIAPRLRVAGRVYGSTVAMETVIEERGQIWGDVYVGRLDVADGGRIQGWVSSLGGSEYQAIRELGHVPPFDPASPGPSDGVPDGHGTVIHDAEQLGLRHKLQAEAATALAARIELEQTFDRRLEEVIGETAARVTALAAQLEQSETAAARLEDELAERTAQLQKREALVTSQASDLATVQQTLRQFRDDMAARQVALDGQQAANARLEALRSDLEAELRQARDDLDRQAGRLTNLESALQAGVQHSAEQQEALQRWQELAEATQARALELEEQLQALRLQLSEQASSRAVSSAAAESGPDAPHRSSRLAQTAELISRISELETEVQERRLAALDPDVTDLKAMQADYLARISELTDSLQERDEQLLWFKVNLETSKGDTDRLRAQLIEVEAELTQYASQVQAQSERLAETLALLVARDESLRRVQAALDKQERLLAEFKQAAGERIRQLNAKLAQRRR